MMSLPPFTDPYPTGLIPVLLTLFVYPGCWNNVCSLQLGPDQWNVNVAMRSPLHQWTIGVRGNGSQQLGGVLWQDAVDKPLVCLPQSINEVVL